MPRVEKHPRIVALLAGIAAASGFVPLGAWPLTLAAFAVLFVLIDRAPGWRAAAWIGWWFGLGHFTLGLNWIAGAFRFQDAMPQWLGWIAVVVLSAYLAVYPALATALAKRASKGRPVALVPAFAASWLVCEYLRATMFTGFAWNPLGVVWVDLGTIATLIGTYGLSAVVILAAGAGYLVVRRQWIGAAAAAALPAFAVLLTAASGLPEPDLAIRLQNQPRLRIVQPNINLDEGRDPFAARAGLNRIAALSGNPGPVPRLLLWPEAALNDAYEIAYDRRLREELAALLGPKDALLTGGTMIEYRQRRAGVGIETVAIGARNSVFALDPAGNIRARYDKAHLVPYGEYLPMRPLLTPLGLARLVPGDLDFWPGPAARSLDVPGFGKLGVQLCYEIIFSGQVVDRADRPRAIFNPSNDAWFGAWGPPQHLAQARLRAIEEGLPVVRSTQTGVSAVIDANGVVQASIPLGKADAIELPLPPALEPTPFARFGNVIPLIFALLLAVSAVALARMRR